MATRIIKGEGASEGVSDGWVGPKLVSRTIKILLDLMESAPLLLWPCPQSTCLTLKGRPCKTYHMTELVVNFPNVGVLDLAPAHSDLQATVAPTLHPEWAAGWSTERRTGDEAKLCLALWLFGLQLDFKNQAIYSANPDPVI